MLSVFIWLIGTGVFLTFSVLGLIYCTHILFFCDSCFEDNARSVQLCLSSAAHIYEGTELISFV